MFLLAERSYQSKSFKKPKISVRLAYPLDNSNSRKLCTGLRSRDSKVFL